MKLIRLLSLRSLRARPTRMILSAFGIVLGVAAILAIGVTNQTAMSSITQIFAETSGRANLIITSTDADAGGFTEKILSGVETYPGVAVAVPSVHVQTALASEAPPSQLGLTFFGTEVSGLTLYGIDPSRDRQVRDYYPVEGSFLSPDLNADEVVLVKDFADENELQVGSWMEIIADSGVEKLRVVGLIEKKGAGQLNNGSFGVIPIQTAQRLFYRQDKLDQIDIIANPENAGSQQLDALLSNIQASLGNKYSVLYPAAQGRRQTEMLSSYQIGLNFLSGMALFVGAFLIFNAFQMSVVERTREFGMLRTVGMSRGQVTVQVLIEALFLGIIGAGLGVALGIIMARGLTRLMEILLGQSLANVQIPQNIIITSALIGVVVAVLAALYPSLQAGRVSPLEALRARALTRQGCLMRWGWLVGLVLFVVSAAILIINPFPNDPQFRVGMMAVIFLFIGGTLLIPATVGIWELILRPLVQLLFGRSGRLGSSNVKRARQRTSLTVAALMIGVSMIIIVWAMTLSFKADLDEWLKGFIGGDLYVSSSIQMGDDVRRRIESVEGVEVVSPSRYFEIEWLQPNGAQEKVMFHAVEPASYSQITSFIFSQALPDAQSAMQQLADGDTVFISSVIAEKTGLQAGDEITLVTKLGERPFIIAAVVVDYYNQGQVITGGWNDMWRYFRQKDANNFLVKIKEGYTADQVGDAIDDQYGQRDRLVIVSNQALLGQVENLMSQAFRMFDVLALIAMLVGFLGISNTLTMNVMERTQEIGMLRGVGMTRGQVIRMIMSEAAVMGLIGGVLGVVFGVILSRIFMAAMMSMSGYSLTYTLPAVRVVVAVVIALVISQVAAFFPARRASRIRILEAIHYE
jgi:putative ABC transport system permease protein